MVMDIVAEVSLGPQILLCSVKMWANFQYFHAYKNCTIMFTLSKYPLHSGTWCKVHYMFLSPYTYTCISVSIPPGFFPFSSSASIFLSYSGFFLHVFSSLASSSLLLSLSLSPYVSLSLSLAADTSALLLCLSLFPFVLWWYVSMAASNSKSL